MGAETSRLSTIAKKYSVWRKYLPRANGSSPVTNGRKSELPCPSKEVQQQVEQPLFTARQKELVATTWKIVQDDIDRVGVAMFIRLFESHPEVQNVFLQFRGQHVPERAYLKSHALRVMTAVNKCVSCFHDPDEVRLMLQQLGARHVMYNARIDYMDVEDETLIFRYDPTTKPQRIQRKSSSSPKGKKKFFKNQN